MTIFDREHEPPAPDEADTAYAVVRAALAGVPLIGNAAVEVLQHVIAPPLARRQQEWMQDIAAAIRQLSSRRGPSLDELRDNSAFIDAVLSTTQAAIRTSQQEKRSALLNAALNAALPGAPQVAEQQMFIALVDRFTEWHLRVLRLFAGQQITTTQRYRHLSPAAIENAIRLLERGNIAATASAASANSNN